MRIGSNKLLIITSDETEGPTWQLGPVAQLAIYLKQVLEGDEFQITGVYELNMMTGGTPWPVRYEVGPASGDPDINPHDKLLTIWYADGSIDEFAFPIDPQP